MADAKAEMIPRHRMEHGMDLADLAEAEFGVPGQELLEEN
jgi:hypothetical protein